MIFNNSDVYEIDDNYNYNDDDDDDDDVPFSFILYLYCCYSLNLLYQK